MCLASLRRSLKRGRHAEAKAEPEAEAEAATTPPPAMVTKPFPSSGGREGKGSTNNNLCFPLLLAFLSSLTLTEALVSVTTAAALVVARPDSRSLSLSFSLLGHETGISEKKKEEEEEKI